MIIELALFAGMWKNQSENCEQVVVLLTAEETKAIHAAYLAFYKAQKGTESAAKARDKVAEDLVKKYHMDKFPAAHVGVIDFNGNGYILYQPYNDIGSCVLP